MKNLAVASAVLLFAGCAGAPVPMAGPQTRPATQPVLTISSSPNRLTPVTASPRAIADPRIRVGLLSDQPTVSFPRTADGYYLVSGSAVSTLRRGFAIAAPLSDARVRYAVQAGAISDKPSVEAFADRIRTETGLRVDTVFDPSGGLYRILVGDFADSATGSPVRDDLVQRGYGKDMLIVRRPSDQPFEKRLAITDDEGERYTIDGPSLLIQPASAETILIGDKPYRTAARIFINGRGLLNVINELNMEDYLKGVVPAEMGPRIFDEVEALKAQAIAARTYAVRNLGQFGVEGYDICPGPACQAYSGFSGEEPLSTRAVNESAGLVITFDGKPIDALYTATCGGETSDVGTMFPGRGDPYLKRKRCVEMEMTSLAGRADSGLLTEQQANARIFAAMAGLPETPAAWSALDVKNAVDAAARLVGFDDESLMPAAMTMAAGMPAPPASSRRGDVLRYLSERFGFSEKAQVLTLPEDRTYFFPQSSDVEGNAYQAAAFLIKFGLVPAQDVDRLDLNVAIPRDELYALLASWLRKHEGLGEATGKIVSVKSRSMVLKADGKNTTFTLPANIPVFRRLGDRLQEYRSAPIMIGDRAFIQRSSRNVPVAVIVNANYDGASFDRTSSFANWTRSYRADELVTSINKRNPIRELQGLRPVTIDASQRIAELEVTAEGGRKFMLRGLPVRWSLNVPDNLFVMEKTVDPDGVDRYTFFGKGWGHGIGFCQVGAYGMAFRGFDAVKILKWYYTGVEVGPMAR
jgi:stage II sporulation protein D